MLKKTIIHKSLYRPNLFVGCELMPFTILILVCGILVIVNQNIITFCLTFIFYLLNIIFIRKINESDAQFFECITRYILNYQEFYPSNAFYPGKNEKKYNYYKGLNL